MSAYDILSRLHGSGLRSPPTVYRALDQLTRRGLVHRLESINAFVACQHPQNCCGKGHRVSAFALCTSCGNVREIDGSSLFAAAQKIASRVFKRTEKMVFEFSGVCKGCGVKDVRKG